ncbi:MAG: hypothetical protein JNL08_03625 [Planctomycetes bacterium]|nr:hypothetical protein [Planctomycetota bacterium]
MTTLRPLLLVATLFAGCATRPSDPFAIAQAAAHRDDLLSALLAYDAVPVLHPHYPEARAGAAAVELRMRRGHELMLQGLLHRGEWRDAEALQCLEQARTVWPDLPGVEALIAATRHRLQLFATEPAAVPMPAPAVAVAAAPAVVEPPPPVPEFVPTASEDESITLGLVTVESQLGRGELESAVVDLLELARRFPTDPRVQRRLARVLQQRALLRYGQGALTAALLDLERILAIEPDNVEVLTLLRAVRDEAAVPAAPL